MHGCPHLHKRMCLWFDILSVPVFGSKHLKDNTASHLLEWGEISEGSVSLSCPSCKDSLWCSSSRNLTAHQSNEGEWCLNWVATYKFPFEPLLKTVILGLFCCCRTDTYSIWSSRHVTKLAKRKLTLARLRPQWWFSGHTCCWFFSFLSVSESSGACSSWDKKTVRSGRSLLRTSMFCSTSSIS